MRIGELADLVGISTRAIRHYHRIGLLAEPARKANGYREYSLRDAVELFHDSSLEPTPPPRRWPGINHRADSAMAATRSSEGGTIAESVTHRERAPRRGTR